MAYTFSTTQLNKINTLFAQAQSKGQDVKGAYAQAYQYVADVLAGKVDQAPGQPAPWSQGKDVQQVQLWFAGAARANAGEGPFATLIREYTQTQAEMRGMGRFSDQLMQRASNEVGRRALAGITRLENKGQLPSINAIANNDASAVGETLFPDVPNFQKNPAWSGVVLFGLLGSDQTWRVYNANGTVTESTQCMDVGYAKVAYNKALEKTVVGLDVLDISSADFDVLSGMAKLQLGMDPGAYTNPTSYPLLALTGAGSTIIGANSTLQKLSATFSACSAAQLSQTAIENSPEVIAATNAVSIPTDAPTRNSDNYITDTSANDHLVVIKAGGKVWDAYVAQRNSATGFNDWNEYKAAVAVSNPGIADLNQIPAGITLYMPEKLVDGSVTYHYANGASINNNAAIGEYHMVVPNTDGSGGQTVYSRVYAGDMDGPNGTLIASYVIKQVSTNAAGAETFNCNGVQQGLGGDILPQSLIRRSDTDGNGSLDQMEQTLYDKNKELAGTITDTPDGNGGFNRHISTVVDGKTLDVEQHIDASKAGVDKDGDGNFIDAGDATTTGVLIGGLCSALKKIAKKSITTKPRGQFSPKSHAAYAGTLKRRPHQPRPRGLAAQGDGVFAGQRLLGTKS